MMKYFYYLIYYAIAIHLTSRWSFLGLLAGRFRKALCKKLFAKTSKNFFVGKGVDFGSLGHIIELEDHANLGNFLKIKGNGGLKVGKHVMMGDDVTIITQDHKYLCPEGYNGYIRAKVVIDDYSWVGDRVIILKGVTIGKHSIIGAGSVVTKNVPDYAIAVGNPARVIKLRKN